MARSTDKNRHSLLGRLSFGSISAVSAGLLFLSYLSIVVDPAKAWFFTLFGLIYPLVLIATATLFVLSLFRRSKMRLVLGLALLPSAFFAGTYFQMGHSDNAPAPGGLKIVSYNVARFQEAGPADIVQYLRGQDADIICLQEFRLPSGTSVEAWLKRNFPGYRADYFVFQGKGGSFGNVTLSKKPILSKGKTTFEGSANMAVFTDIKLDGSVVRLYNCHFESYNISLPRVVKGITDEDIFEETERKMRRSITERPKQVAKVLKEIASDGQSTIVLGDFNDTPLSYTYFRLSRGLKDSFVKAGHGFGATYSGLWPLLRLDYILVPGELKPETYKIDKVKYSDHYPIIATYHESGRNTR